MLRIGQPQSAPDGPPAGGPPMPPPDAQAPPDAGAPPPPPDQGAGGSDHKHELIEALTYMQMAMELIMSCLQKYQAEGGDEPEPTDNPDEEDTENAPALPTGK